MMIKEVIIRIIQEQELIMGSVAWIEASKVEGIRVDVSAHEITLEKDSRDVIEGLVRQYERLFGNASLEVCRDAVRPLLADLTPNDIPDILR